MTSCNTAIIGAGPYGLSLAAHLRGRGHEFRIFGVPMDTWTTRMPKGMRLKSEGFASSLYDPNGEFTLGTYCQRQSLPYADIGLPVPLDTFTAYGLKFQQKFVPNLENKIVESLSRSATGFELRLSDGEVCVARSVVLAVGLTHYSYLPPVFADCPKEFVTHSSAHHDLDRFRGRSVALIGSGASALDLAALLHQAGADVQVLARGSELRFQSPPTKRTWFDRLRAPNTGLSQGWDLVFCTKAPLLFHKMPERFRHDFVRRTLGPAPCWFVKQEVVGNVSTHLGVNVTNITLKNSSVALELTNNVGDRKSISADHVVAATGYRVDLRRLNFVNSELRSAIRHADHSPILSPRFESSVPGLYFVGVSAANSFGPLLRFAYGAGFAARHLTKHLTKSGSYESAPITKRQQEASAAI